MAIIEEKVSSVSTTCGSSEGTSNEIEVSLQKTGHYTCSYPNGFTVGVRLEAIPRTRGVHVDIVFVLDLRVTKFGKSGLAMRSAVLETVDRNLGKILDDVGLGGHLIERTVFTVRGRVRFPVLVNLDGTRSSFVHETRSVYVVTENVRPSVDLSWLTDSKRIVPASEFVLVRNSDSRSLLPSLAELVSGEKWIFFEKAIKFGWWSIIAAAGLLLGLISFVNATTLDGGLSLLPLFLSIGSLLALLYFFRVCDLHLQRFNSRCVIERERLDVLCDKNRIDRAISENQEMLTLVGDLNFVVSPIMASAVESLRDGDLAGAVSSACTILDECVRRSQSNSSSDDLFGSTDEGLNKFLGLFDILGANVEKERLALAYVALSAYPVSPIPEAELAEHLGMLNNALFDAGILRPNVKETVDDILNEWAMKITVEDLSRELSSDEPVERVSIRSGDTIESTPEEVSIVEIIAKAGESVNEASIDEMPTITAEDV